MTRKSSSWTLALGGNRIDMAKRNLCLALSQVWLMEIAVVSTTGNVVRVTSIEMVIHFCGYYFCFCSVTHLFFNWMQMWAASVLLYQTGKHIRESENSVYFCYLWKMVTGQSAVWVLRVAASLDQVLALAATLKMWRESWLRNDCRHVSCVSNYCIAYAQFNWLWQTLLKINRQSK